MPRCTFPIRLSCCSIYFLTRPLDLQQSGSEFAADMRLLVLLLCLSASLSKVKANDPLGVINAILDTVGISYVPPPARPGTCRDCSRSSLARFGVDLTPTLPTNPCCETTPTPPTPTATCKCGVEGTTRIVGGEQSTASISHYYPKTF